MCTAFKFLFILYFAVSTRIFHITNKLFSLLFYFALWFCGVWIATSFEVVTLSTDLLQASTYKWPAPSCLDNSVGRASAVQSHGHGFESSSLSIDLFQASVYKWPAPSCLDNSVGRASAVQSHGHGFDSSSLSIDLFQASIYKWPAPSCLDNSVGRASAVQFHGHRFESHSSLDFLGFLFFVVMIFPNFISFHSAAQIYKGSYFP